MSMRREIDRIDPAAEIAGEEAKQRADQAGQRRRDDRDEGGDLRAVNEAREDIAAEAVGAEEISRIATRLPGRGKQGVEEVLVERVVRGEKRRRDRDDEEQRDDDAAGNRARIEADWPAQPFDRR